MFLTQYNPPYKADMKEMLRDNFLNYYAGNLRILDSPSPLSEIATHVSYPYQIIRLNQTPPLTSMLNFYIF